MHINDITGPLLLLWTQITHTILQCAHIAKFLILGTEMIETPNLVFAFCRFQNFKKRYTFKNKSSV